MGIIFCFWRFEAEIGKYGEFRYGTAEWVPTAKVSRLTSKSLKQKIMPTQFPKPHAQNNIESCKG